MEQECIKELAYAKLNLNFKIVDKTPSNYHLVDSYVSFLPNLYDHLLIRKSKKNKIFISGKFGSSLKKSGGDTLIKNTINLLSKILKKNLTLEIYLKKNIPLGSGLGGGSADAAAVIRGIIKLYKLDNKKNLILKNLYKIGSDVPVCYFSKNAKVSGIGEIIKPLKNLKEKLWILLIKPPTCYSTKCIFQNFNEPFLKSSTFSFTLNNIINDMNHYKNSLENTVCKLEENVKNIIKKLPNSYNITKPRITGSGSTIFIMFKKKKEMYKYKHELNLNNKNYWIKPTFLTL